MRLPFSDVLGGNDDIIDSIGDNLLEYFPNVVKEKLVYGIETGEEFNEEEINYTSCLIDCWKLLIVSRELEALGVWVGGESVVIFVNMFEENIIPLSI